MLWVGLFVHVDPPQTASAPSLKRVFKMRFFTDFTGDLVLHWGIGKMHPHEWLCPDSELLPPTSVVFDPKKAVQTFFTQDEVFYGFKSILIEIPADLLQIKGISFVFMVPNTVTSCII
jgi:hypothetical protein